MQPPLIMVSMQLYLAAFFQILAIIHASDDLRIISTNGTITALEDTPLSLTCVTKDPKKDIKWYMNSTEVTPEAGFAVKKETDEKGYKKIHLSKAMLKINDSGEYKCIDLASSSTTSVEVNVFSVKTYNGTIVSGKPASIRCEAENVHNLLSFNWTKDQVMVSKVSEMSGRFVEHENSTLEIFKAKRKDAGLYQCVYKIGTNSSSKSFSINVAMNMAPFIHSTEKSRNLVQGDKLQLECNVQSYPPASIIWKRDNITFEKGQRIHWDNKTLTIYDLQFSDKGKYICIASNMIGNGSMTVLVRVKDKLAALWPFLGIVAEVVILCIIIFICEKKRSKDMEEDYDSAGQQNMPNAKDHKGKDEIRQRNVRT
ncbi:neuroplastin-like [Argonauta hians]